MIDNPMIQIIELEPHSPAIRSCGIKSWNALTKIDDVNQTFTMDYAIICYWFEDETQLSMNDPSSDIKKEIKILKDKPDWVPTFVFYNAAETEVTEETYRRLNGIYYGFFNWTVTINEALEIERFPFDRQLLKIILTTDSCKMVSWDSSIPLPPKAPVDCVLGVVYEYDNWVIVGGDAFFFHEDGGSWDLVMIVKAERSPYFYLFNIVGILFLIVMFAASVYAIPLDDFAARLSVVMTLLLTVVAFKFVTNSWVPQVSYLTLLDKYTMISIFMLMIQVLENFLVALYSDIDGIDIRDANFAVAYSCVWVSFHIYILVAAYFGWFCISWEEVRKVDGSGGQSWKIDEIPGGKED